MSINLHCEEVELWQTPTWVTEMCLSVSNPADGVCDGGWRGVLHRYKIWVRMHSQGIWENQEDYEHEQARINAHLKDLDAAAKKKRSLTFYSM